MSKIRPQRPSADGTRKKILKAALQLFMQYGFAGTSMGKVAEKADVNQTLIFHHFGNKKQLWEQVKIAIVESIQAPAIAGMPENLYQFLSEVVNQRIAIYTQCPQLKKLISWQQLDSVHNKKQLAGISNSAASPLKWAEPILFLQEKKLLNPEVNPELLIIWLVASIDGLLDDHLGLFKSNPQKQKIYIDMLIDGLAKGLSG